MAAQAQDQLSFSTCSNCGLFHPRTSPCPISGSLPVLAPQASLAPGAMVGGRFRIVEVTHRSTMSTVYRAVDERARFEPVAIKEFTSESLSEEERAESLKWLAREAGLLSSLKSPYLAELIAAFSEGDLHYLVMPYIAGETLREACVRSGPMSEIDAVHCGALLADILIFLHAQSPPIIHRDLKPANILLRPDGRIVLLDLGVARPIQAGEVGTAIGTPGYAPPEQYQGIADERSDLYALGATLHYILTGYDASEHLPFRHPPVRELNQNISPGMERLVAKLLQTVPDRRPASAVQTRAALSNLDRFGGLVSRALYAHSAQLLIGGAIALLILQFAANQMDLGDVTAMLSPLPVALALLPAYVPAVRKAVRQEPRIGQARRNVIAVVWLSYLCYIVTSVVLLGPSPLIGLLLIAFACVAMVSFSCMAELGLRRATALELEGAAIPLTLSQP